MAQRITILPESLTNKIAAGEVVERPASVIKELIENSLDAGATEITVEIVAGGRRSIRVTDNGFGMSREDGLLSLERHATSKIKNADDLGNIVTLGFRGEALPSIASVSRFKLSSREHQSNEGVEIVVDGGRVRDVKACGMPVGTVISVEQIFYNLPARQKFMKSAETEAAHAADIVTRLAVSRPDITFKCISDGKELLKLQKGDLARRMLQIVGRESVDNLYEVKSKRDGCKVSGYVSGPSMARSATNSIYTFINGRFIKDKVVQHALMQAYRGVIDRGRYPVVALFIELAADEVDVNVHPTKHEVRFRRQSIIHDIIQSAIEDVLKRSPWLPAVISNTADSIVRTTSQAERERLSAAAQNVLPISLGGSSLSFIERENAVYDSIIIPSGKSEKMPETVDESATDFMPDCSTETSRGFFSSLTIIGQFHNEYIICQSSSEIIIIDQHAASERVAYQYMLHQSKLDGVESQRLLFPETMQVTFSEAAVVVKYADHLTKLGFELEPFGGATLLVSAVPRLAVSGNPINLVRDIIAELESLGISKAFEDVMESVIARIACHSVIRGSHQLESRQIMELLRRMDATDFAASCPHGRPVYHNITLNELQKIFKRI